jgi:hypothetical protein
MLGSDEAKARGSILDQRTCFLYSITIIVIIFVLFSCLSRPCLRRGSAVHNPTGRLAIGKNVGASQVQEE